MAKAFCLTKELADKLKQSAINGEINIAKMYEMTSAQRSSLFEKYVSKDIAQKINAGFEEAMSSNQQTALKRWAEATFNEKAKAKKKDILDKIERLQETGLLTPENEDAFLSDLVATKLGVTVTAEEASTIAEKSEKLKELGKQESEFGTPTMEYFKARKDMEDYLASLNPSSKLKVTTSISGRGAMLASLKSPLVNIESNTVQAFLKGIERRILSGKISGKNGQYAMDYIKFVNKVFSETGYDVTRMRSLESDQQIRGEEITTTQGEGLTRKIGRLYEDLIFKKLMGAPDVAFSSVAFSDRANLVSTAIAKAEGLKGEELKNKALSIFKDATRINPKTPEGKKVREQAITDAEYSTYTNKSVYSDVSLAIRGVLNLASGDLRLGDQLMPFVKTPANVVGAGIDYSGVVLPIDTLMRVGKTIQNIYKGDSVTEASMEAFKGYSEKLVRAGLGITLSVILSNLFEPEDFIGEYPTSAKERELLELQNATTNSVRIGDRWWSLDYFGALGTPLVAMLYAKKYGKDIKSSVGNYYIGAGRQLKKIPGLEIGKDVFETLSRTKFEGFDPIFNQLKKGVVDYVGSRTIPAIVSDIAKATDSFERQVNKENMLDPIKAKIPGLRQTLDPKMTVLGEDIPTENPLSVLLLGSRSKTVAKSPVINEISRLANTNNLPSITNYAETSGRMKELKVQIGNDKFKEAEKYLGVNLNKRFERIMKTGEYKKADDENKAKLLNKVKEETLDDTLKKFKYKAPKKKK